MPDTGFDSIALSGGYLHNGATKERMSLATIPVGAGINETTIIAKYAGVLAAAQFVAKDVLAASDTNFITFTVVNRGTGAGTTAMLAATAVNTTQTTGGSALAAYVKRGLTLNATPANLAVAAGDTISVLATVTGTLANAVTAPSFLLTFTPTPS
jgi:hypothetical protein